MTYTINTDGQLIRDLDGAVIPNDSMNSDYAAYLDWCAAGGVATHQGVSPQTVDQKVAALNLACQSAIYAGFHSSALGADYLYPAQQMDQLNLASSVLASLMPGNPVDWKTPFWCADSNGVWTYMQHTAAQIQQVGQDGKLAIVAALVHNQQLIAAVQAAKTAEAITAVNW